MNTLPKKLLASAGYGLLSTFLIAKIRDELRYRSLQGAVVLISGGSRGLGLVLAKEYAKSGASIALLARDQAELDRAMNIIQFHAPDTLVHTFVCDCKKPDQIERTVAEVYSTFGQIDVLVNNAGVISSAPIQNAHEEEFAESLDIHFWAPYHLIQECLPYMERGSRIVNISSIGGLIPIPHRASYCAGKHALVGFSRSLHAELAAKKIYVTTVCPNVMRTGSIDHATFNGQAKKEYAWFSIMASLPLISSSAESAARKIVSATKYGKAELTLSLPTKIAALLQAQFPNTFSDLMFLANAVLPEPSLEQTPSVEGKDAHSFISPSFLTRASQKAAERNNEGRIVK